MSVPVSILDEMFSRDGTVLPAFAGVNWAKAGDRVWTREEHESENAFRARVRTEADREGFRLVQIGGMIATNEAPRVLPFRPTPAPRYRDAKED
jgi:hypothetical protein